MYKWELIFFSDVQTFVWDACRDTTLIILMVAAAASLALGIKTEVRLKRVIS